MMPFNLYWFFTGEGPSGFDADTVDIKLLEQEAAARQDRKWETFV
jgi:hypothetical protein